MKYQPVCMCPHALLGLLQIFPWLSKKCHYGLAASRIRLKQQLNAHIITILAYDIYVYIGACLISVD